MTAFRAKLVGSICIQALSPALLFLLALLISRMQGPVALGVFATGKALVDLLVAIGGFGFGQSIVSAIHRCGANRRRLFSITSLYSAALIVIFGFILINIAPQPLANTKAQAIFISCCAAAIVFNNLSRAILLTVQDGVAFALYTAVPGIVFFAVFSTGLVADIQMDLFFPDLAMAVALIVVVCGTVFALPSVTLGPGTSAALPWSILFRNGLDAFIQQIFVVAQVYLSLHILQRSGEDPRQAGWFSIGIMLHQAISMPLQMVGPVLVRRWMSESKHEAKTNELIRIFRACAFAGIFSIILAPLLHIFIPMVFGNEFTGASTVGLIFILSTYAILVGRTCATILVAEEKFRMNAKHAALRAAVVLMLATSIVFFSKIEAFAMAVCWAVSEVISAIYILRKVSKLLSVPWPSLLLGR
jgi:O-antigen/teichoic acid export membrane protein